VLEGDLGRVGERGTGEECVMKHLTKQRDCYPSEVAVEVLIVEIVRILQFPVRYKFLCTIPTVIGRRAGIDILNI